MTEYKLFSEVSVGGDKNEPVSYGIILLINGVAKEVFDDISCDRAAVERLIELFNSEGLEPVHFAQAVEDYLYDFTI